MLMSGSYHYTDETEISELNERLTNPWLNYDRYDSDAQTLKIGLQVEGEWKLKKRQLFGVRSVYWVSLHRAIILVNKAVSYEVDDDTDSYCINDFSRSCFEGCEASYSEDEKKFSFLADVVTLSCVVESFDCKLEIEESPSDYFERSVLFGIFEGVPNRYSLDCP